MTTIDAGTHLPVTKEIKDLLTGLLGREVELTPTAPLAPSLTSPRSVGVYVDDRLVVRAVVACDLEFSARAGAAIALMPAPVADEAIRANGLDDILSENLYEVFSVVSSAFNAPAARHLRLLDLHAAGNPIPRHVQGYMLTLGRREDLEIVIAGYGPGRLSVVVCG